MKTILVCIDFSDHTEPVIEQALTMARAFAAELELLHVGAPDPDFVGMRVGPAHVRDNRAAELRDERQELKKLTTRIEEEGVTVRSHLVLGGTVETLLEKARELPADMIVMGSHGYGPMKTAMLGSVSTAVIRNAPCPVLVISRRMT